MKKNMVQMQKSIFVCCKASLAKNCTVLIGRKIFTGFVNN